jgi:Family of unknown function (DUF5681)
MKTNSISNLKPFKKGTSGNPAGKKKGTKHAATLIRKFLESKAKLTNSVTGERATMSHFEGVILAQIAKALNSDTQAFNALLDRLEGKPMQRIEAEIESQNVNVEVSAKRRTEILKAFKNEF